jgi:hypothetical protein
VDPTAWPQFPFDSPPNIPECSKPAYTIQEDTDVRIPMRDGVRLVADVFRPSAPGQKFPALLAVSPYTRQLQRTVVPSHQNEAGTCFVDGKTIQQRIPVRQAQIKPILQSIGVMKWIAGDHNREET